MTKSEALIFVELIVTVAAILGIGAIRQVFYEHSVKADLFSTPDAASQQCNALVQNYTAIHPNVEPSAGSLNCSPYQQIYQNGQWSASASFNGWAWPQ